MKDGRLEVSDLMNGDWVDVRCDAAPNTPHIERITPAHFLRDEIWLPIPLTKEILEKIGLVCTQKADEDEMGAAYECWSFRDGLLSIEFEPEVVMLEVHNGGENGDAVRTITYYTDNDIMYLHELQHALRLCGITLI